MSALQLQAQQQRQNDRRRQRGLRVDLPDAPMHQSFDDDLMWRDARGSLCDDMGILVDDAVCEECCEPTPTALIKFFHGKARCESCRYFWKAALKPKPSLKSARGRARARGLPATLTEDQWQETLEHFNHLCAYCGKQPWRCVEHATPLPPGGTTINNCLPACGVCNSLKRGKTLEDMVNGPSTYAREAQAWEPALLWLRSKGRV
jgi:hypothetical protein